MNVHNEYEFTPGVYRHHKGMFFVALDLVTHKENAISGDMEKLDDPEIIYRELVVEPEHVNGKLMTPHRRFSMKLSEWKKMIDGTPRFQIEQ